MKLSCFFRGHDDLLKVDRSRLYVECFTCGRRTIGITVSEKSRVERFRRRLRLLTAVRRLA